MDRLTMNRLLACLLLTFCCTSLYAEEKFRLGIIGTTTSHAPAFVNLIHAPDAVAPVSHFRVVAAFPGGVPDNPRSWGRVERFANDLEQRGVQLYSTIEAMLPEVDGILLLSVDGRPRLEQAKPVIAAGLPIYLDKPMAACLADVLEIFRLAEENNVPIFSSSALRFATNFQRMRNEKPLGEVFGVNAWSPCAIDERHPDLFFYGIHGVETLFTLMGPGWQTVSRTQTAQTELVVGVWEDGRIGTFRGLRSGRQGFGALVFGERGIGEAGIYDGYLPLVTAFCEFFLTGEPPFDPRETIEIIAFMEAADISRDRGGMPVSFEETLERAKNLVSIFVDLHILSDGALRLNGEAIELDKLTEAFDSLVADKPNTRVKVILHAERGVLHEILLSVCNRIATSGNAVLANFLYER